MPRLSASLLLALVAIPVGMGAAHRDHTPGPDALAEPPRPLPFFYDLYTFRGDSGATAVVASFAVRAGELDRESVDGESRYRFNVTLVLADTARGTWSRSDDSVFVSVPRPLDDDHLLHTHIETRAPPSATILQRVLMINAPTPGTGQLYTRAYPIRDYRGDELMLSDIALGLPLEGGGGGWTRGDVTLALLPSSHFPSGVFEVFYEVYNLPAEHRYTTEFSFQAVNESGLPRPGVDPAVRVHFSGESASGPDDSLAELRRVDASLAPGSYRLTVTVTDEDTGRTARRSRILRVREWAEGATMVPACPVAPGVDRPHCRTGHR